MGNMVDLKVGFKLLGVDGEINLVEVVKDEVKDQIDVVKDEVISEVNVIKDEVCDQVIVLVDSVKNVVKDQLQ